VDTSNIIIIIIIIIIKASACRKRTHTRQYQHYTLRRNSQMHIGLGRNLNNFKKEQATLRPEVRNWYAAKFMNKVLTRSQKQNSTNLKTAIGTVVVVVVVVVVRCTSVGIWEEVYLQRLKEQELQERYNCTHTHTHTQHPTRTWRQILEDAGRRPPSINGMQNWEKYSVWKYQNIAGMKKQNTI
jgi:hypothetical protein